MHFHRLGDRAFPHYRWTLNALIGSFLAGAGPFLTAGVCGATASQGPALQVTVADTRGNLVYDLALTSRSSPNAALISGTQKAFNTDGASHGSYDAVVWAPNSFTGTLDLIVSDITKSQIVRYSGPKYGTGTVLFNWAAKGKGSGPAYPVGLSIDGTGNLYVISPRSSRDATTSLWVLPYGKTTGNYGAPILIDDSFSGVRTIALADVLVAGAAATSDGNAAPAWNAGDLLVLVGDTFDSRVIVYSQAAINRVISTSKPLGGPSSTAVTLTQFESKGALPLGMDIWPADAVHGAGASLLFATVDGRLIRFDSGRNSFIADFADGLGVNVQRVKVGSYLNIPYAFVAQLLSSSGGEILQYGAPPASGTTIGTNMAPLAKVSKGLNNPFGVAITMSGSAQLSTCEAPNTCSPIGPQLTLQISVPPGDTFPPALSNSRILETSCTVANDPRVQFVGGSWTCNGGTLDIANFCPSFPHTLLPPFLCGHSGTSGSAFSVLEGTAITTDENANNVFFNFSLDETVPLPGNNDLTCPTSPSPMPALPLIAWATRSDLPNIEGYVQEDLVTNPPTPFFIELTGLCDTSATRPKGGSMLAFGLGLNASPSGLGAGVGSGMPGFVTAKFNNLLATITAATIDTHVSMELQGYVQQAQSFFNSELNSGSVNGYSCAANEIASADAYARANFSSFHFSAPPAGNYNPLGEIDGRLANLFLAIDSYFLGELPNTTWPATNVPPCETLIAQPATVQSGAASMLTWSPGSSPAYPSYYLASACTVLGPSSNVLASGTGAGSVSSGNLTTLGANNFTLECTTAGSAAQGLAGAIVTVTALPQTITFGTAPTVFVGATGTISAAASSGLPLIYTAGPASICTIGGTTLTGVSAGTCTVTAHQAGNSTYQAATGRQMVPILPPVLQSIALSPAQASAAPGGMQSFVATGIYNVGSPQDITTSVAWTSTNPGAASVVAGSGLATCSASATGATTTTIVATGEGGVNAAATLNCLAPSVTGVALNYTSTQTIEVQTSLQLLAMATYSDNATQDVTTSATWFSNNNFANPNASGLVTGTHAGSSTVTASYLNVTSAPTNFVVTDFTVTPPNSQSTAPGGTLTYAVGITGVQGFTDTVSGGTCALSALGASTSSFSAPVSLSAVTFTGTINVVLNVDPAVMPGSYSFSCLLASAQGDTHSATLQVIVNPSTPQSSLNQPNGLAFGPNGDLYVASASDGQVLVYAPVNFGFYNYSGQVMQPAMALSAGLVTPVRLAFDSAGNLYVADIGNNSVVVFNSAGVQLPNATISVNRPLGVAVDQFGNVYVAENTNDQIDAFYYPNGLTGAPALTVSWTEDVGHLNFISPGSLAYDAGHSPGSGLANTFAIGDVVNGVRFYPASSTPQDQPTSFENVTAGVNEPTGIAFDFQDNIYVVNYGDGSVSKYSPGGVQAALSLSGAPLPAVTNPEGVAVDPYGNLYVSNTPNNVIQVYSANGAYQYMLGNISLSASGGSSSQLSWSAPGLAANATCTLSSDDGGPTYAGLAASGSQAVTPNLTGRSTPVNYTLTCGNYSAVAQVPSASLALIQVGQGVQPTHTPAWGETLVAGVSGVSAGPYVSYTVNRAGVPSGGGNTCTITDGGNGQVDLSNFAAGAIASIGGNVNSGFTGLYEVSLSCTVGTVITSVATLSIVVQ